MRTRHIGPPLVAVLLALLLLAASLAAAAEEEPAVPAEVAAPAAAADPAPPADPPPEPLLRRRPGSPPESEPDPAPPLPNQPAEFIPVPDRWRIMDSLGREQKWWDPYNFNILKADQPLPGTDDWFFNLRIISDSLFEPRRLPTPIGVPATNNSGSLDIFGDGEQYFANQNLIVSTSLIQGDTVFKPPDWEFRFTGVMNWNYTRVETVGLIDIDPNEGVRRYDDHFAIQELFIDRHLGNVSDRYDFFSVRAGIQPFTTDFRGFLFADNPVGVRLFGNFYNNRIQWNLAWFRRVEKDTNSGLNSTIDLRADDLYIANVYFQDFPVLGFTVQGTIIHNRNREGSRNPHYDDNGFIQRPVGIGSLRPHNYQVTYFGLNGDGHLGRINLTYSAYFAGGHDKLNPVANRAVSIRAWMAAAEASIDYDWSRLKVFGLYASGDDDSFDSKGGGWDPIFENPNFAGGDTSFWVRQGIPYIGGGTVALSGRNALIPSLRPSKEKGQTNFVNPGLILAGVGGDFDLLPELRLTLNSYYLLFDDTSSLEVARTQGSVGRRIGWDLSAALLYRPAFIENIVFRLSGSLLLADNDFEELYDDRGNPPFYSALVNLILTY